MDHIVIAEPLKHGLWGPVTATLDWCEANYQFSHYIAEMANTTSNLLSIWIALHGARLCLNESLPTRYMLGFSLFILVGLGSFAFHATLLYEAQLADELPMIYGTSYGMFLLFDTTNGYGLHSTRAKSLAIGLTLFNVLFSWTYYMWRNPVYHQLVFGALVIAAATRTMYLQKAESHRIPAEVRSTISKIFLWGVATFTFGFIVWNLDNVFCNIVTRWKVALGWPLAFLLEGHSWWHVFTGIGAYLQVVGITYLTLCVKDDYRNYAVGYSFYLPHVKRVSHKESENEKGRQPSP